MKKLTNPKILIPILIVVAVVIVIAVSGMTGGEVAVSDHGHTH